MRTIDVGKDFYFRLANRNRFQGDGKFNAEDFRRKYLKDLDNPDVWKKADKIITFDFTNIKKIGPSFANEAFAYFMEYTDPENFLQKIIFENATEVQLMIIKKELESGYAK